MCTREEAKIDRSDKLIQIEWDIIHDLIKLLAKARRYNEKVRIANSLAYHVNCLNKLLIQKGESPLEDENLGAILTKVPKKWRSAVLKDSKKWKKKSSLIDWLPILVTRQP